MRVARAILFLDRRVIVGAVHVVITDAAPRIILLGADTFLPMSIPPAWEAKAVLAYGQELPFRADEGRLEVVP